MTIVYNSGDRWHAKQIMENLIASVQNFWYDPRIYLSALSQQLPWRGSSFTPLCDLQLITSLFPLEIGSRTNFPNKQTLIHLNTLHVFLSEDF